MLRHQDPIQVFEHDYLKLGECGFTQDHFDALVKLNEQYGSQYFSVGYRKLKFNSFVGVIQVKGLTIEVLPKADRHEDKNKWRLALLTMLRACHDLDIHSVSEATLSLRKASLLDLYINTFLKETEKLVHAGLTKKYRKQQENVKTLKGKILFTNNIRRNYVHQENVFTEHQVYDEDTLINQILKRALLILKDLQSNYTFSSRINNLLIEFEGVSGVQIHEKHFNQSQNLNRKTIQYQTALQFAKLIILYLSPDMGAGREKTFALLFDMNVLFEKYIYLLLKRKIAEGNYPGLTIQGQSSRLFWGNQRIRPDIVLSRPDGDKVVVDTKWKIIYDYRPSGADLKQMYAYNVHFGAKKSILLYPKAVADSPILANYHQSDLLSGQHSCGLYFASLFNDEGKPRVEAGAEILDFISNQ